MRGGKLKVQEFRKPLQKEMISPLEDTQDCNFKSDLVFFKSSYICWVGLDSRIRLLLRILAEEIAPPSFNHSDSFQTIFANPSVRILSQSLARCEHGV